MNSSYSSKITSLLLSLFVISIAWSSPPKILNIPLEIEPIQLIAKDINGDGIKDIIVGAMDVPLESFSLGQPGTAYVQSMSDNLGGLVDRVVGSLDSDGIGILIADGKGGFEPPDYLLGERPFGVADVNEDGLLDIITETAVILRNKNNGWSIGPSHDRITGLSDTADFDGDGHIDFIARDDRATYSPFRIFYGDGTGQFIKDNEFYSRYEYPVAGDVNQDGLIDIVMAYHDELYVYLNMGDRKWAEPNVYSISFDQNTGFDYPGRPSLADFTGDSIIDITVGHFIMDEFALFKGNGDGTFQEARDIGDIHCVGSTAAADFNKDGISDVVACEDKGGRKTGTPRNLVTIIYGDSQEQFNKQARIPLGSIHQDVTTGDFNNDGWEDISVVSWGTNTISILYNDGTGSFGDTSVLDSNYVIQMAADIDSDGHKDIIFERDDYERFLFLAYGETDGTFGEPDLLSDNLTSYSENVHPNATILGYFDETVDQIKNVGSDRRLDVAFIATDHMYSFRRVLYILLNKGNRTWSTPIRVIEKNYMGSDMITGDFNEDGFQDIITSEFFLAGNGDGTFQSSDFGLESVEAIPKAITDDVGQSAIDLDNDGHLDIVAIENVSEPGAWLGWGKGDGSFEFTWDARIRVQVSKLSTGPGSRIWLADFNNDGLFDIVEPEQIMLNLGHRSFSNALPFGGEPLDVNGDDICDLIYSYRLFGLNEVRFGTGNFGWSSPEAWICGGPPWGTSVIYGPLDDPFSNILVGTYTTGDSWAYPNPWKGTSVSDNSGPRILEYMGPLNPGFITTPTEFVLTLSEPIDPETVHSDSVYLASAGLDGLLRSYDDLRLNGMLSYDEANRKIKFIPESPLVEGPHQFVVSGDGISAIRDFAGNALDGEVYNGFASGDDQPGGNFVSTFYIVDMPPEPQALDSRENDISDELTAPKLIGFDSNRRATITGDVYGYYDSDCFFLGELTAGDVVMVDLDGLGAGLTLEGGAVSIQRNLPVGWIAFGAECFTDGFVDSLLSFPVHSDGEYELVVSAYKRSIGGQITQNQGTYSLDVAIDSRVNPWEPIPQTIFLDFDGSQTNLWGNVEQFDAGQLDLDSSLTNKMISSITAKVLEDFEQFPNIIITAEQPVGIDYSRISIGPVSFLVDPVVDSWNLNHTDESIVNTYTFWGIRHYGLDAVSQAMVNTISHQIGHLLGLQHLTTEDNWSWKRIMNDHTPVSYLIQDQSLSKGNFWWNHPYKYEVIQDSVYILEYNTGPTLPMPIPPTIDSLTAVAYSNSSFLLEAHNVSDIDGKVVKVEFYRDENADLKLGIGVDKYLRTDSNPSSWMGVVDTSEYSEGTHIFLARAMDNDGAWSNVVSATVTINEP